MSNLVKVKDVIERVNTKEDRFNTDRLYYVGGEHFQSRALTVDDRGIIKGSTIGPMFYYGFKSNDFLLVSRNPHLRKAGLVNFDGICSEKTFVLHTKDERILLQKFMPFIFQNERFWKYAIANKHGSTNFFVNWSTLADYSFELPSIEQQKAISKLLWALNDTKKAYEDLIQKTDELVKSQFIEMFGDPRENPFKWPVVNFNDIAESKIGLTYKPADIKPGGILVLRSGNIQDSKISLNDNVYVVADVKDELLVRENDILMCSRNGSAALVGKVALIPQFKERVTFGAFMTVIRSRYYNYLFEYFQQPAFREQISAGTSTINQITQKMLAQINLPLPPRELQDQFTEVRKQSDKSKFELNEAIKDLDAMYKRIIKDNLG